MVPQVVPPCALPSRGTPLSWKHLRFVFLDEYSSLEASLESDLLEWKTCVCVRVCMWLCCPPFSPVDVHKTLHRGPAHTRLDSSLLVPRDPVMLGTSADGQVMADQSFLSRKSRKAPVGLDPWFLSRLAGSLEVLGFSFSIV